MSQRLLRHNNGSGSQSTKEITNRPWSVASYICGLSHMNKVHRMSLERSWKLYIQDLTIRGIHDTYSRIKVGQHVMEFYNALNTNNQIRFVICVALETVNDN